MPHPNEVVKGSLPFVANLRVRVVDRAVSYFADSFDIAVGVVIVLLG